MASLTASGYVFLSVIFVTMISYVAYGILSTSAYGAKALTSVTEFTASPNTLTLDVYAHSSIAYFLQLSTTFYFVYFGYNYGFGNIFYIFAWVAGFYLFSLFLPSLMAARGQYKTFSQFLSSEYSSYLYKIIAFIVGISFISLVYVETFYLAEFSSNLIAKDGDPNQKAIWWIVFVMAIGCIALCSVGGGFYRTSVTDMFQLSICYVAFGIAFAMLTPTAFKYAGFPALISSIFVLILFFAIRLTTVVKGNNRFVTSALNISIIIIFISIVYSYISVPFNESKALIPSLTSQLDGWGYVTVAVFMLVNIFWQFADASNYQRITALHVDETKPDQALLDAKRALHSTMIASPITWGIGIFLGVFIRLSGLISPADGSEFSSFLQFLSAETTGPNQLYATILAIALLVAMISVMMSTADSAIMTFLQAATVDILKTKEASIVSAVLTGAAGLSVLAALAFAHKGFGLADVLTVTGGANAQLLVLGFPALARLRGSRPPEWLMIATVIGGSFGCWFGTFFSLTGLLVPSAVAIVLPFIFVFSAAIPLVVWMISQPNQSAAKLGR